MTLRVAIAFSGGKDSTYATWIAQHQGWDVSLVTVRPHSADSLMFHHPNVEWTHLQAQALRLSHEVVDLNDADEMKDLQRALVKMKSRDEFSGLVTGAVASDYQKTRFDNMCDAIGLKTYSPLWHKNPRLLVDDLKKSGFRIILTAVAAKGLDESWLGRELTETEWPKLERLSKIHGIHLTGEGGEYESFVLDTPHFSKRIEIEKSRKEWYGDSGRMVIEKASLRDKLGN
jgi:ABC transporter with metal-binding/Fe-S-binding domain ATP-binding protein